MNAIADTILAGSLASIRLEYDPATRTARYTHQNQNGIADFNAVESIGGTKEITDISDLYARCLRAACKENSDLVKYIALYECSCMETLGLKSIIPSRHIRDYEVPRMYDMIKLLSFYPKSVYLTPFGNITDVPCGLINYYINGAEIANTNFPLFTENDYHDPVKAMVAWWTYNGYNHVVYGAKFTRSMTDLYTDNTDFDSLEAFVTDMLNDDEVASLYKKLSIESVDEIYKAPMDTEKEIWIINTILQARMKALFLS